MQDWYDNNPLEVWVTQVFAQQLANAAPFGNLLAGAGLATSNPLTEVIAPTSRLRLGPPSCHRQLLPPVLPGQETVETGSSVEYVENLRIEGPLPFRQAVRRILWLLKERAPRRYGEVVKYLPQAVFDPERFKRDRWRGVANSSGYFSQAGVGTWLALLTAILHEAGHNVAFQYGDSSEDAANAYESAVLGELSVASTGAGTVDEIVKDWERVKDGCR